MKKLILIAAVFTFCAPSSIEAGVVCRGRVCEVVTTTVQTTRHIVGTWGSPTRGVQRRSNRRGRRIHRWVSVGYGCQGG